MPEKEIANFKIKHIQILDKDGNCDEALMPQLTPEQIKDMYKYMVIGRTYDDKALKLQRQGRLGTYASILGQEASNVGTAAALKKTDWMVPAFREEAAWIMRGVPIKIIHMYWAGDEWGSYIPEDVNNLMVAVPIASQIPHAVGLAKAAKIKGDNIAVMVYFGDGATSEGDFHEAMNFAGVFKLPVVFVCQNNQWAISVPCDKQTAAETIAQKAIAYGFEGIQVDGNDIFAVYKATKYAVDKAKEGKGPTLIECFTYRMGDHTTADDAKRYRTEEDVNKWKDKDPVIRLKNYMKAKGIWSDDDEVKLLEKAKELVDKAVEEFEATEKQKPEEMFKYMFKEMPWHLKEQMDELHDIIKARGGGE